MPKVYTDDEINAIMAPRVREEPGQWLGTIFVSASLDMLLLGFLLMQFARWRATGFHSDNRINRAIVFFSTITGVAASIFGHVWTYELSVLQNGSFVDVVINKWWASFLILAPIQSAPVQLHYAIKAFRLYNNSFVVFGSTMFFVVLSIVGAINARVALGQIANAVVIDRSTHLIVGVNMWLISAVIADVLITGLCTIKFVRSRTGWIKTNTLLKKLIRLAWECQTPPTVFTVATLINFHFKFPTLKYPYCILSAKVYAVCLLYGLNERNNLIQKKDASFGVENFSGTTSSGVHSQGQTHTLPPAKGPAFPLEVRVKQERIVDHTGGLYNAAGQAEATRTFYEGTASHAGTNHSVTAIDDDSETMELDQVETLHPGEALAWQRV